MPQPMRALKRVVSSLRTLTPWWSMDHGLAKTWLENDILFIAAPSQIPIIQIRFCSDSGRTNAQFFQLDPTFVEPRDEEKPPKRIRTAERVHPFEGTIESFRKMLVAASKGCLTRIQMEDSRVAEVGTFEVDLPLGISVCVNAYFFSSEEIELVITYPRPH